MAFLELANRLRDRVETARVALEQLDALHAALLRRIEALRREKAGEPETPAAAYDRRR